MIRKMREQDVNTVVKTHLASFPGFFLSFLGPRFLSLYYTKISSHPEGICFVYLNTEGMPAGFVVGSENPRGFYTRLLKLDWFHFSLAALRAMLRKPTVIWRIARAFFHPSDNPPGDEVAGLFSIGVLPELQGTGVGQQLVQTFLEEARRRGCRKVFLTTDRDGNVSVNSFYEKLGFRVERQFDTPEGRRINEYWIDIAPDKRM